jgi:hypothetical protein
VFHIPVTVVELPLFQRLARGVWDEAERMGFIDYIARNPEAGNVIPDTGGVRKIRWRGKNTGKRGGVRVIYFYHDDKLPIFLLQIYAKAQQENMSSDEKAQARAFVAALKLGHRRKGF